VKIDGPKTIAPSTFPPPLPPVPDRSLQSTEPPIPSDVQAVTSNDIPSSRGPPSPPEPRRSIQPPIPPAPPPALIPTSPPLPYRSYGASEEGASGGIADSSPPTFQLPLPVRDDTLAVPVRDEAPPVPVRVDSPSESVISGSLSSENGEEDQPGKKQEKKDKKDSKSETKESKKEKKQKKHKQKDKDEQPPDSGMTEAPTEAVQDPENPAEKKGKKKGVRGIFAAKASKKLGQDEETRARSVSKGKIKSAKKSKHVEAAEPIQATQDVTDDHVSGLQQDWEQRTWLEGVSSDMLQIATFLNQFELATRSKLSELNLKLDRLERILDELEGKFYTFEQTDKDKKS